MQPWACWPTTPGVLACDGTGMAVAVIDSGVHGVDDLKDAQGHNRILYNYDSLGGGADDQYGHGTHVAGIIGGSGKIQSVPTVT